MLAFTCLEDVVVGICFPWARHNLNFLILGVRWIFKMSDIRGPIFQSRTSELEVPKRTCDENQKAKNRTTPKESTA